MLLQRLPGKESYQWPSSEEKERPAEVQVCEQGQMTHEQTVKVTYSEYLVVLH
jgi:hypothetical protein